MAAESRGEHFGRSRIDIVIKRPRRKGGSKVESAFHLSNIRMLYALFCEVVLNTKYCIISIYVTSVLISSTMTFSFCRSINNTMQLALC